MLDSLSSNRILLTLEDENKRIYRVTIDPSWLDKIPGVREDLLKLEDRGVQIDNIVTRKVGENAIEIEVARAEDFRVR